MSHQKTIKILFLGASKRVSLIERFLDSAGSLGVKLKIYTCEKDESFCPISRYAEILAGPKFASDAFQGWLKETIDKYKIDIVIPNMDSATVALSRFKEDNPKTKALICVSSFSLCEAMNDKTLSDQFFHQHGIAAPANTAGALPKIAKPKLGFGAKGIVKLFSSKDLANFREKNDLDDFLIQDLIEGEETTVDFYVNKKGSLIGVVLRDRLEVSDGEVMVCKTREPNAEEKKLIEKIAAIPGWYGCITLQYIRDHSGNLFVIEINPRFGGGATCAIEAGLDMPAFILKDFLGEDYMAITRYKKLMMTRARRDFFYEYK